MRRAATPSHLHVWLGLAVLLVAVAIVAVSYKANDGLPLESSRRLTVELPSADRLTSHDDVRIGGVRVGQVVDVEARLVDGERPRTRVELRLDPSVEVPVDSRAQAQSASILGASFLSLTLGRSPETIPDGGRLAFAQARPTTQLTDLLGIFDRATARHIQGGLAELAPGLAGRGEATSRTLASLASLLGPLERVSRTLAAPSTDLGGFIDGAASFSGALEPVTPRLASLVGGGSRTFGALASRREALGRTIDELPGTERSVTAGLDALRPGLQGLAALSSRLRPAAGLIPGSLTRVNAALTAGVPTLRGLPPFSRRLGTAVAALDRLGRGRASLRALVRTTDTLKAADPVLTDLGAAQEHCNVIALWARNFSSAGELGAGHGPVMAGVGVTTLGARNELLQNPRPSANVGINYLPNQTAGECESGNEGYRGVQVLNNPPGNQSTSVPETEPPTGVRELAERAGLLDAGATP